MVEVGGCGVMGCYSVGGVASGCGLWYSLILVAWWFCCIGWLWYVYCYLVGIYCMMCLTCGCFDGWTGWCWAFVMIVW